MRRWLSLGSALVLAALVIGCGRLPAYRMLDANNRDGYVELTILTDAGTARDVRRVIDAAVAGARRELQAYHVTVYVVDTDIYIGVVYDVAVAYWDRGRLGGKETVYLREKILHPGSVPRPSTEELAYYGIEHRLWLNRPDLLLPEEQAFYDQFKAGHTATELDDVLVRVQRWLFH